MNHASGTFRGKDGVELFWQSWEPERGAKAKLILVHGLGEHCGRYTQLVDHLTENGYAVYAYDHVGHGQSGGRKGYVVSWEDYREGLTSFRNQVVSEGQKPFLMGHSMGGLIVLDYVIHHPGAFRGVIATAPAVDLGAAPPGMVTLAKVLNAVAPKMQISSPLDANAISRDKEKVQAYVDDPLVHNKITPAWMVAMVKTVEGVQGNASKITLPILLTHGDSDKIVPIGGTKILYEKIASADKKLIIYEGGHHEAHNDTNWEEAVTNIGDWLDHRL